MNHLHQTRPLLLALSLALSACYEQYDKGTAAAAAPEPVAPSGPSDGGGYDSVEEYFAARVKADLGVCRSCHVPGGAGDTDAGKRLMLSDDGTDDYVRLQSAWTSLGEGVDDNLLLLNPAGRHAHSGGAPWPEGSQQHAEMKTLLGCWDQPERCESLIGGSGALPPPSADDTALRAFFADEVQPNLGYCRICHQPGRIASWPFFIQEQGEIFLLSRNRDDDYVNVYAGWNNLGRGVEENLLLRNPSGGYIHAGGAPWPKRSRAYASMKTVLSCWETPQDCEALLAGGQ